jgi:putative intracellular protease/amidase
MRRRVLCLLAPGFEEIETVAPVDLLCRAGAEVVIASLSSNTGGRGHFRHVHPVRWPKDEMAVVQGY